MLVNTVISTITSGSINPGGAASFGGVLIKSL